MFGATTCPSHIYCNQPLEQILDDIAFISYPILLKGDKGDDDDTPHDEHDTNDDVACEVCILHVVHMYRYLPCVTLCLHTG